MVKGFSILTSVAVCGAALAVFSDNGETQSVDVQRLRNRGQATYEEKQYADSVRAFTEVLSNASASLTSIKKVLVSRPVVVNSWKDLS